MIAFWLVLALIVAPAQQSSSIPASAQQQAHASYEHHKQAAIRINKLANHIHSDADASTLVSQIATVFANELPPTWSSRRVLDRVAHAEFEAVSDSARLIPEQQIASVWNEYAREIGAPEERLVTAAEIHNVRDAQFTSAKLLWERGQQTVWTMPNMYALGSDGKVADGCRAIEALRVIYDLHSLVQNLRAARERLQKGVVVSDEVARRLEDSNPRPKGTTRLEARVHEADPVRSAEHRYVQEHGALAFSDLMQRLFDELFPRN